jgi:integrase
MARPRKSNRHLPKYVIVHHGAYWYRPPSGEDVRIGECPGEEHKVWEFMMERAAPQAPPKPGAPLHEYFERYKREIVPTLGPRTQKDYSRHIAILDKVFGHMHPDEVKPRDIGAFLDRPKGRIQANRQVSVLSAIYGKLVGRWYVAEKNPCRDVERNASKKRDRYVTDEEFAAVYAVAGARIRVAMDLALLTGQRQGDLISLPWSNVTKEGILFRQGKTGKRLLVGMSPDLEAALARAKLLTPVQDIGGYVLHTRSGKPYTSEGFRACWQRTINRAMKGRRAYRRRKKKPVAALVPTLTQRFTFHDLRAKSVSDSKNIQEAFERAGHTSMAMTRGVYDRGIRLVKPLK